MLPECCDVTGFEFSSFDDDSVPVACACHSTHVYLLAYGHWKGHVPSQATFDCQKCCAMTKSKQCRQYRNNSMMSGSICCKCRCHCLLQNFCPTSQCPSLSHTHTHTHTQTAITAHYWTSDEDESDASSSSEAKPRFFMPSSGSMPQLESGWLSDALQERFPGLGKLLQWSQV